jgi:glucosamine-6-phosphate deaminase
MALSRQIEQLALQIYPDSTELVNAAVDRVSHHLQVTIQQKGQATVILASGSSQIQFLKALTAAPLNWPKITCFHLDEYLGIAADHPASFQRYMRELVADRVPLAQFHYLNSETLQPLQECRRYGQLLAAQPIDLCLLGIGENGHIAFNDPLVADFQDPDPVKIVRLAEKSRQQQVDVGFFNDLGKVPQYAMTLSIPSIRRAEHICCLALGQRKARIVQRLLQETISPSLPVTVLRQQNHATLMLDAEAAAFI